MHASALKIQAVHRGKQARKELQELRETNAAAKSIQAVHRGKLARREVQELREMHVSPNAAVDLEPVFWLSCGMFGESFCFIFLRTGCSAPRDFLLCQKWASSVNKYRFRGSRSGNILAATKFAASIVDGSSQLTW